jgi:hypothetical protein
LDTAAQVYASFANNIWHLSQPWLSFRWGVLF